jgi:hypothetical protein
VTAAGHEPIRYGDLLELASASLAQARTELYRLPLGSVEQARATVAAHRDLMAALGEQLRQLYRPQLGLDDSLHGMTQLRDGAAMALLAELEAVGKSADWKLTTGITEGAAGSLVRASQEVRAAADLIATHVDIVARARTPEASRLFDPDLREDAVLTLARLSADAGRLRESLELRLYELAQQQPTRTLPSPPDTDALIEVAEGVQFAAVASERSDTPGLLSLGLARPPIRRESAADELSDRIARLRRVAWELPDRQHVGVATLSDYAALGVITHAHAIVTLESVAHEDDVSRKHLLVPYRHAHRQWLSIRRQLVPMRSAVPAIQGVRADVLAAKRLLETMAPIPAESSARTVMKLEPSTVETVLDAARPMSEIAEWNAAVMKQLASHQDLLIRARALPGEELSEQIELAGRALADGFVPIPAHLVGNVERAYRLATEWIKTPQSASSGFVSLSAVLT